MIINALLLITGGGSLVAAFLAILGASVYDVRHDRLVRHRLAHPSARRYRNRPWITVIILSDNNAQTIEDCLRSLLKNGYRKQRIIVADNASKDNSQRFVRALIGRYPRSICLYTSKTKKGHAELIKNSLRGKQPGELTFVVSAASTVSKNCVKSAIDRFNVQPDLSVLNVAHGVRQITSLAGLLKNYSLLVENCFRKACSVVNADYFADFRAGFFCRSAVLSQVADCLWTQSASPLLGLGDLELKMGYEGDGTILITDNRKWRGLFKNHFSRQIYRYLSIKSSLQLLQSPQTPKHSNFLIWLGLPLVIVFNLIQLMVPVAIVYSLYLAIVLKEPSLLMIVTIGVTLVIGQAIVSDHSLSLIRKVAYILLSPVNYAYLVLATLLQYLSVIRVVFKRRHHLAAS